MKIPDEMWRCPNCGAGFEDGEGLVGPEYTEFAEYQEAYGPDADPESEFYCYCGKCDWEGQPAEIVAAHMKKHNRKPCPHCEGTGWVSG